MPLKGDRRKVRLLRENIGDGLCVLILLDSKSALPFVRFIREIEDGVTEGTIKILPDVVHTAVQRHKSDYTVADVDRRDRAYKAIEKLVDPANVKIFFEEYRGEMIAEAAKISGHHISSIYNWLTRFWQRGQTPDALLPKFHRCGGPRGSAKRILKMRSKRISMARDTTCLKLTVLA
jgi:hypothetical protein